MNSDIILEILLKSDETTIIQMCQTNRQIKSICLHHKNVIAKHIMQDIYQLNKPKSFLNYASFYKHFKKTKKLTPYLYGLNDNPSIHEISRVYTKWYKHIDTILKGKKI